MTDKHPLTSNPKVIEGELREYARQLVSFQEENSRQSAAIDLLQANIHERERLLLESNDLLRRAWAHAYSKAGLRIRDKYGHLYDDVERRIKEIGNGQITPVETTGKPIGAQRYVLKVGHSQDAGLGAEGWVVRMSDHFSDCEPGQKWVKSEDYEALRQRFERACQRVTELESSSVEPSPPHPGPSIEKAFTNSPRRVEPTRRIPPREFDIESHTGLYTEPAARKATYRDIYPDDPTWWKEGMTSPWFELPSTLPENGGAEHG